MDFVLVVDFNVRFGRDARTEFETDFPFLSGFLNKIFTSNVLQVASKHTQRRPSLDYRKMTDFLLRLVHTAFGKRIRFGIASAAARLRFGSCHSYTLCLCLSVCAGTAVGEAAATSAVRFFYPSRARDECDTNTRDSIHTYDVCERVVINAAQVCDEQRSEGKRDGGPLLSSQCLRN